jgi:hypothetical protein
MVTGVTGLEGISPAKEKPKIISEVIKVFNEIESRNGFQRIQVIKWGKYKPKLEKREYYTDDENITDFGSEKVGKLKGFSFEDLELIEKNMDEIKKLLK